MNFVNKFSGWEKFLLFFGTAVVVIVLLWGLVKLVRWAKKMPAGAYLMLALFPLISLFPIPPAEIKKLQRVKQEQVKQKQESGDPASDEPPPH